MGYYSDIVIVTTEDGYKRLTDLIAQRTNLEDLLGDCEVKHGTIGKESHEHLYVSLRWNGQKWYEEYEDVKAVMDSLDGLENENIPYRYTRVGEDYDDVETENYDDEGVLPSILVNRTISIDNW